MSRETYFQNALSNFVFEVACGGAIRHLASQGYTSRQIKERLSFPVSYDRVREAVTGYFLDLGILLRQEPVEGERQERYVYVQDHGKYGKVSFRRVPVQQEEPGEESGVWHERSVTCTEFAKQLERLDGRETKRAYVCCEFGGTGMEFEGFEMLDERQREYLQGICWDRKPMYHQLNERMRAIVHQLCLNGAWSGKLYLEDEREILVPLKGAGLKNMEAEDAET